MTRITLDALRLHVPGAAEADIVGWIERDLVAAERTAAGWTLGEVDVARIRLIVELRGLSVEDETLPLVLALLDRLYAERRRLHRVRDALTRAPADLREELLDLLSNP